MLSHSCAGVSEYISSSKYKDKPRSPELEMRLAQTRLYTKKSEEDEIIRVFARNRQSSPVGEENQCAKGEGERSPY